MANLKDIRSRIASVKNTQQITKAMKMVSAAKLKRAQDQIQNMRPYAHKILSVISDIAHTQRIEHPLLNQVAEPKTVLMVVITSDRGLCGGFNSNVSKFTEKFITDHGKDFEKLDFIFIGRKGATYFKRRDIKAIDTMENMAREICYELADDLAKKCLDAFIDGGYDEIRFVYNEFKSAIEQKLTVETLMPVDVSKSNFNAEDCVFCKDLIFEPQPAEMIEELLGEHFAMQVFRCLSESVAAEHAARMTAMENATSNANEMVDKLTLTYNKLRQAAITTELTEICSGAEAINAN